MHDQNIIVGTLIERMNKMSRWTDPKEFSEREICDAVAGATLWHLNEPVSPRDLPLDDEERCDGRQFFRVSQARVAASVPGDILEIMLPDTRETLKLLVERVEVGSNQLPKWEGKIINNDVAGSFNMTRGNNFVSGHITTSRNTYSFELIGKKGWIHESRALFTGEALTVYPIVDTRVTLSGQEYPAAINLQVRV